MKITNSILSKLKRLMDMAYRISEIAMELGVSEPTVRDWISRLDAPHRKDGNGHIWIIGTELRDWILAQQKEKSSRRQSLAEGEFWCLVCGKPVTVAESEETEIKPNH